MERTSSRESRRVTNESYQGQTLKIMRTSTLFITFLEEYLAQNYSSPLKRRLPAIEINDILIVLEI